MLTPFPSAFFESARMASLDGESRTSGSAEPSAADRMEYTDADISLGLVSKKADPWWKIGW